MLLICRYIPRYNKELEAVQPYHEPEYHRGYYRGRGRGRYQSVVRKAIGRIGPPGGGSGEGPPSYYNTDSYSANRYFISIIISLFILSSLSQLWHSVSIVSLLLYSYIILRYYKCYAFIFHHWNYYYTIFPALLWHKTYIKHPLYTRQQSGVSSFSSLRKEVE